MSHVKINLDLLVSNSSINCRLHITESGVLGIQLAGNFQENLLNNIYHKCVIVKLN